MTIGPDYNYEYSDKVKESLGNLILENQSGTLEGKSNLDEEVRELGKYSITENGKITFTIDEKEYKPFEKEESGKVNQQGIMRPQTIPEPEPENDEPYAGDDGNGDPIDTEEGVKAGEPDELKESEIPEQNFDGDGKDLITDDSGDYEGEKKTN